MKKQALFPVLITLVVTALALIGSSFAWFTVANTVKISQITATAQTDSVDLRLSFDAINFYSGEITIPNSSDVIMPEKLFQVSTAGKVSNPGLIDFFDAKVQEIRNAANPSLNKDRIATYKDLTVEQNADGTLKAADLGSHPNYGEAGKAFGEASSAVKPTYIVFDLYVYVDHAADLYLYKDAAVQCQNAVDDATPAEALLKSLRIGFLYEGSVAESSYSTDDLKKVNTTDSTGKFIIWEPSQSVDSGSSIVPTYGVKSASAGSFYDAYVEQSTYTEAVTTYSTNQLLVDETNSTTGKTALSSNLTQGYHKFRVYIWLEANDPDCVDTVAAKYLKVDLALIALEHHS